MSNNEMQELSDKLRRGLQLAEKSTLNIDLMKCCAYSFQVGTFRTTFRV